MHYAAICIRAANKTHGEKDIQRFVVHQRSFMVSAKWTPRWATKSGPGAKDSRALLSPPPDRAGPRLSRGPASLGRAKTFLGYSFS